MNFYAINGSPRKKNNTATLLTKALEGVAAVLPDAQTEMLHLYDYSYKGCISCFECKKLGGKSYGKCAVKDELAQVLEKLSRADGIIFGSPIYFGNITGEMRSFFERLLFPSLVYDATYSSIAPKKMKTAFIYTMNVNEDFMKKMNYPENLGVMENFIGRMLTPPSTLYVTDTYQFNDYSKYKMESFSEADKRKRKDEEFPKDCQKAFELGMAMARI